MTLRIQKFDERNRVVLTLIDRIRADQVSELEALLTSVTDYDSVIESEGRQVGGLGRRLVPRADGRRWEQSSGTAQHSFESGFWKSGTSNERNRNISSSSQLRKEKEIRE